MTAVRKSVYLTANVAYGLDRPDLADEFRSEIERILSGK